MRTVTANFSGGQTFVATESLWQYDYGFVLVLQGLQLPTYYEVHFSHTFTQLADVNIGDANGVTIDDKFLRHDGYLFAWVYLHDEVTDGYTKYQVKIPIAKRARPPEDPPTHEQQAALAQAITALNEQTGRAEDAANRAEQSKVSAKASEDAAALSEQNASGSAEAAASSERNAAQSELDAAASAATAMDKASDAIQAANAAIAAANTAEGAAGSVTEDALRAETAATHAEQYSDAAQIAKEGAVASEQSAQRHKNDAVDAKEAAQSAASTATQKAQAAEDYAGIASQKAEVATDKALEASLFATDASGSASNAAVSETQAEISATAAVNAETEAKNARDLAQGYATAANESKLAAVAAQGYAEAAQAAAETAQGKAEAAEESVEDMLEAFQSPTATAVTLDPGSDATASYNGETGVFTFGIPEGAQGTPGTDGYSPSASVSQDGDVTTITITDEDGTTTADIDLSDYAKEDDLTELGHTKAPVITDTASGAIASFPDGADGMPMHKLVVNLSPVQDLHGQDAPYPAGGGKNLIPLFANETKETVTLTNNNGEITLNGTATADAYFEIFVNIPIASGTTFYLCCFNPVATDSRVSLFAVTTEGNPQKNMDTVNGKTITVAFNDLTITKIKLRAPVGVQLNNFKCSPMLQVGGTEPTAFAPYSNICPITGWTGANVTRTGKNIYPVLLTDENFSNNGGATHSKSNGELTINTINSSESCGVYVNVSIATLSSILRLLGDKQRTISFDAVASVSTPVRVTSGNSTLITVGTTKARYCVPSTGVNFNFYAISTASTIVVSNLQIEIGTTTESSYEPYSGNTISVTFPSSAGTVYGGNLDVTTGVLTVTDAQIASYAGEMLPGEWISDRDVYVAGTTPTTGAQVVYKLATPQTYQLTAQQMTTLLGSNNIWANTGDVEVEYCADTKLYIELLTQPTEDDMTANANIAANRFFMIGNNLYYSTSAIAAGATIIPGTNCTAISLADALNQLNT